MTATAVARQEPRVVSFAPRTMAEAMDFAKMISDSAFVPRDFRGKPGDILIAIQMGAELGLAPMQALQSISVINGRPSVWGDGALALVKASGLLHDHEEKIVGEGDKRAGYCRMERRDQATPYVGEFSIEQAKRAGLWDKAGPWKQYPDRMLKMRARGFVLRDGFADVLRGLITREEAMDFPPEDEQRKPATSGLPTPRRLSDREQSIAPVESSAGLDGSRPGRAGGSVDQTGQRPPQPGGAPSVDEALREIEESPYLAPPLRDGVARSRAAVAARKEIEAPAEPQDLAPTLRASLEAAQAKVAARKGAASAEPPGSQPPSAVDAAPPFDPETGEIIEAEPRVGKKDLARIFAAAKDGGHPDDAVRAWLYPKYGVSSTKELPASKVNEVVMRLADPTELPGCES